MTSTCPSGHTSTADDYCDVCGAPIAPDGAGSPSGPAAMPPSGSAAAAPAQGGSAAAGPAGGGAPASVLDLDAPSDPPADPPAGRPCPNCGAQSLPGALFCEDCGYDFTTGQLPRSDAGPALPAAAPPAGTDARPETGAATAGDPAEAVPPPLPSAAGAPDPAASPARWVAEVWVDPDWHAAQEVTEPCPSPGMPVVVGLRGTNHLIGRRSVSRNIHPQIDCGADTGVSRRHAQLTTDGQRWWVEDLQSANGTYVGTASAALPDHPVSPGQRNELPEDARIYLGAWTRIVVRAATDQERSSV